MISVVAERSFPSAEWFAALSAHATSEPQRFRSLGVADFRLAVEIVDTDGKVRTFGMVFDGYDITCAGEFSDPQVFGAEATVTGPIEAWQAMVANIAELGAADGSHTLNALSIADTPLKVVADDPMGRDKFFRYAETLQTLFDASGLVALARS
ncbi:MAG: hypothetical protein ACYCVN_11805 [Acidimicrobiales bacterium]